MRVGVGGVVHMASRTCTVVDSHGPPLVSEVMQATLRLFEHIAIGALLSIEMSVRKKTEES